MHVADGEEVHQRADKGHDDQHDGSKVVDPKTQDNLEGSDARCVMEVHPGKIQLQGLGVIGREFLQQDGHRRREGGGDDCRFQPVSLARQFPAEEHHQHEAGQREDEDDEREGDQSFRRHKRQVSVVSGQ